MSQKNRQKGDKKSDAHIQLEKRCQNLISELLDKDMILKKAEDKGTRLGIDLHEAKTEVLKLKNYIRDEFEKLSLTNQNLKSRVSELTGNKNELQIQLATLKAKLQFERKENEDVRKQKEKQYDDLKRHFSTELGRYELQATEYAIAINEKQGFLAERQKLLEMISSEREQYKRKLADRDRDKIQAIDSFKKQMKEKTKDMKNSLLSIRREQLDNNTRLTHLQNHQLIQELEYQSINTQKIVDKNVEMEVKIRRLETELEVREMVEKEVAKRSTISKKMLKTMQEKVNILEQQNKKMNEEKKKWEQKDKNEEATKKKMNQLMRTIEGAHQTIEKLEKTLALKQAELNQNVKKISDLKGRGEKIIEVLCTFYENTMISTSNDQVRGLEDLNLDKIRQKDVKDWKKWEVQLFVQVLLNQLKNYMESKHFNIQVWKKISDSKISKMLPNNKENLETECERTNKKYDSAYVRSLSLERNKLYYQNQRKISAKNRSLTKNASQQISLCKYVQTNVREWGRDVNKINSKTLAERFMKPIKTKLK